MTNPGPWHFITSEYPPQSGGISDYVYLLAEHLASPQEPVHIWCPPSAGIVPELPWVTVHATLGWFAPSDLKKTSRELKSFPPPRRLLVHWVPHGYGYKSLNIGFCVWLWNRVWRHGDRLDLMVHEPFFRFGRYGWRQNAAAAVHRLMTVILLEAAGRVWIATPKWKDFLKIYAFGRNLDFEWLPLASNVPRADDASAVIRARERYGSDGPLIGHFGNFGPLIAPMLNDILSLVLSQVPTASVLLVGAGGEEFCARFIGANPGLAARVHATGFINARNPDLSAMIDACDLLVQPYPDGVTSRRTTVMAGLSHGKPIVTTFGALTEAFWQTRKAVVLAPAGDARAFADAVGNALGISAVRTSLATAARTLYDECFQIDRIAGLLRQSRQRPARKKRWTTPKDPGMCLDEMGKDG